MYEMDKMDKKFASLVDSGKPLAFHGVDCNCFKLGKQVFEAVENEDDGYRSYLDSIEVRDTTGLIFFRYRLATVELIEHEGVDFGGYFLRDVDDGHIWLRFGTDEWNDYYPVFVFEYNPRKGE